MTNPLQDIADDGLDAEEIHKMAMILINALGRAQALEKARRQECDTAFRSRIARAVRKDVEKLCNGGVSTVVRLQKFSA